jgi:hypothetical protein
MKILHLLKEKKRSVRSSYKAHYFAPAAPFSSSRIPARCSDASEAAGGTSSRSTGATPSASSTGCVRVCYDEIYIIYKIGILTTPFGAFIAPTLLFMYIQLTNTRTLPLNSHNSRMATKVREPRRALSHACATSKVPSTNLFVLFFCFLGQQISLPTTDTSAVAVPGSLPIPAVILPPSALDRLSEYPTPCTRELSNTHTHRYTRNTPPVISTFLFSFFWERSGCPYLLSDVHPQIKERQQRDSRFF